MQNSKLNNNYVPIYQVLLQDYIKVLLQDVIKCYYKITSKVLLQDYIRCYNEMP